MFCGQNALAVTRVLAWCCDQKKETAGIATVSRAAIHQPAPRAP